MVRVCTSMFKARCGMLLCSSRWLAPHSHCFPPSFLTPEEGSFARSIPHPNHGSENAQLSVLSGAGHWLKVLLATAGSRAHQSLPSDTLCSQLKAGLCSPSCQQELAGCSLEPVQLWGICRRARPWESMSCTQQLPRRENPLQSALVQQQQV